MASELQNLRDDARECFEELEIDFKSITPRQLAKLREMVNDNYIAGDFLGSKLRANKTIKHKYDANGDLKFAEITCRAGYFKKRTCIIFEKNGFIGFCGWADTTNTKPVVQAFKDWCWKLAGGKI